VNVGPLIAGMATMPSRAALLPRALEAVLPQIDRLHLFLDRFDDVPACARDVKIIVYRSQEAGDLRANGKLLGLAEAPADALYFTMDDDIAYPRNYTARMAAHMARYDHAIALGVHGLRLHAPITRYLESRRAHPRAKPLVIDRAMHILGTDTVVIPKALATFDVRAWDAVNMVDLNFAYELAQRRIPRVIINRRRRWVHDAAPAGSDSIFAALKKDDTRQTDLARKLLELDTLRPPEPRGGFGARLANTWAERFAVFNPHA
jgi:hypothetical protein